ncbi:hypothetical protein BAE44_0021915 [Dichanthelium oligosanthes]|uniref:Uncharacterized protein n=1 Tax=Dichanthelium oligosanthes TaxID=888268 RepID=A0A1E5UVZ6_9POAL|nr:hypothetical protein BAE44_0021915 [Dichanthelium oligosanthes]
MAVLRKNLVLPVIMLVMVLSVVLGASRPLVGEELSGEATASVSIVRFIQQLYWQRLSGPGASCSTWDPNNGCPPPP